ncbi:MAG: hypothetical protein AB7G37_09705 [Solirubrobacteraceae bacterium]
MSTSAFVVCTSCGRHLLRGETPEVFLDDGTRHEVCALCVPRALHAGWIRVGVDGAPTLEPDRGRRGSLREWFRRRGPKRGGPPTPTAGRRERPARPAGRRPGSPGEQKRPSDPSEGDLASVQRMAPTRRPHRIEDELDMATDEAYEAVSLAEQGTTAGGGRAQVISAGTRMAARAVDLYNHSEHPRTVAGVARSLGPPWVTIRTIEGSLMRIVIAWELTWYRFEVDLARESNGVNATGNGSALGDLLPGDVEPNAVADEHGYLYLYDADDTE